MEDTVTEAVRKQYEAYSYPPPIEDAEKFLKKWGVTLHKLRHSHASHLLAANVHPKVVQERLGHSSISITLDIYSHLMPNMQGEAANAVDGVFRAAINKTSDDAG